MSSTLRIATRKSALALWQSEHVASLLRERFPDLEVQLLPMSTRGDEILDRSLTEIGGKGLFLKELEKALLEHQADLAVHSLKDVPAESPPALALQAFLPRADAGDLWIATDGARPVDIAAGSVVGSSSLRRISQLRALRPDLEVTALRGNVETRLAAVAEGRVDATVLAAAGLRRLDIVPGHAVDLPVRDWLPAPGQGVITVQARADDRGVADKLAALDCRETRVRALAERGVIHTLGGDCRMPLAAFAEIVDGVIQLRARLGDKQGMLIEAAVSGPPETGLALGKEAAEILLENGGRELLERLTLEPE